MVASSTDAPVPLGEFVPEADRRIVLNVLEDGQYVERDNSECLPGVDIALLCRLAAITPTSAAVDKLREILRAAR